MNRIYILFILGFFIMPGFLSAYSQQNTVQDSTLPNANNISLGRLFEQTISEYQEGIRFKDVIPVAIGILLFSYFIWKSSNVLSKREIFSLKNKYTTEGSKISPGRKRIFQIVKYLLIFPMMMYGWVVVCFFFMYSLNTSLSFGTLALIMVGIISASRIAAHWNEKLAEDIMKFLPFNLLFTLLLNPVLDTDKILSSVQQFPLILLELTIFIAFTSVLEGILKVIYFLVTKNRHPSTDLNSPIKKT